MLFVWPLVFGLGYYFAPFVLCIVWLRYLWQFRSGLLRALAFAVLVLTLVTSLNSQTIPSFNAYWSFVLGFALLLPCFSPAQPEARPYQLASQIVLLLLSLALHLWYAYLYQRPQFDNSFAYYAIPCMTIMLSLSLPILSRQKKLTARLLLLLAALVLGLVAGQFFYLNA